MNLLVLLLLAPLVTAGLLPRVPKIYLRTAAMLGTGLSLLLALVAFEMAGSGVPLTFNGAWAPAAGIGLRLEADGVSGALLALNGLLFMLAVLATRVGEIDRPRLFLALLLSAEAAVSGALLARDLVFFFVCFDAVLVPVFFLVSIFGEGNRQAAAIKLLVYTGVGSLAMLLSILALYAAQPAATASFAFDHLSQVRLSGASLFLGLSTADLAFVGFALAFAVKSPMFPFHGWLPDAYTAAPTPVVMVLAGVISKLGPYGFYRVAIGLMPASAPRFSPLLMTLSAVGIVYGALVALRQDDAKRMVAYLSLSHMCFITLGILTLTSAGMAGGVLQMVNHGILVAGLFFIVGHLERRLRTRQRSRIRGISGRAPALAAVFLVLALATLGLPGLNGFAGEYLVMLGAAARSGWLVLLSAAGVVLAAWYTLRLYQGTMNGPREPGEAIDIDLDDSYVLVPLAALAVLIGVYPALVVDTINRALPEVTRALGGGG